MTVLLRNRNGKWGEEDWQSSKLTSVRVPKKLNHYGRHNRGSTTIDHIIQAVQSGVKEFSEDHFSIYDPKEEVLANFSTLFPLPPLTHSTAPYKHVEILFRHAYGADVHPRLDDGTYTEVHAEHRVYIGLVHGINLDQVFYLHMAQSAATPEPFPHVEEAQVILASRASHNGHHVGYLTEELLIPLEEISIKTLWLPESNLKQAQLMEKFRWVESERAGYDLGPSADVHFCTTYGKTFRTTMNRRLKALKESLHFN